MNAIPFYKKKNFFNLLNKSIFTENSKVVNKDFKKRSNTLFFRKTT